jgi:hypothetical protein
MELVASSHGHGRREGEAGARALRTVVSAEELDGVDEARVEGGRPPHSRRPRGAARLREPRPGAAHCPAPRAGHVARFAEARPAAHGAVLVVLVQRHAADGPQHGGVGVVVQPAGGAALSRACSGGGAGAGVHGHRQRQRERHGHGGQLQRRRHGRRRAPNSSSIPPAGGEEPRVDCGGVVVVIVGRCTGGQADLEGEIRLGREELHDIDGDASCHSLSLFWLATRSSPLCLPCYHTCVAAAGKEACLSFSLLSWCKL